MFQSRHEYLAHLAYCWRPGVEHSSLAVIGSCADNSSAHRLHANRASPLRAGAPRPLPVWASPGSGLPGAAPAPARKRRKTAAALNAVLGAAAALPPPAVFGTSRVSAPEQPELTQMRGRTPLRREPGRPPRSLLASRPMGRSSFTAATQVPSPAYLGLKIGDHACPSAIGFLEVHAILRQRQSMLLYHLVALACAPCASISPDFPDSACDAQLNMMFAPCSGPRVGKCGRDSRPFHPFARRKHAADACTASGLA